RGNSREYLYERLVRGGFTELLRAVDAGTLTVYAAAAEVGLVTRPTPSGRGSPNARKRIDWAVHQAYRASARAHGAAEAAAGDEPAPGSSTPGRSTMPIDLVAALAEAEEMRAASARPGRPTVDFAGNFDRGVDHPHDRRIDRDLPAEAIDHDARDLVAERDRLLSIIDRLEARLHDQPFAHAAIPCTTCSSPCATAAMKEIVDVYVAARRGEQDLAGNVLPLRCCKRQLRCVDARALIA